MPTENQVRGEWGEKQVAKLVDCQVCRARKLSQLAGSFPSLDLVCRNCGGYLAQVKTPKIDAAKAPDWRPRVESFRRAPLRLLAGAEPDPFYEHDK